MGLWFTFFLGIFIVLGAVVVFYLKNSEDFITFSVSLASGVILMLIVVDLIPEVFETAPFTGWGKYFMIVVGIFFGFILLYVLDKFIPDHEDDIHTKKDDHKNLEHIGLMSSIALIVHNIVEGMAIVLLAERDVLAAFTASIGIGLHNIPLGMIIASSFYQQNEDKKKTFLMISLVSLSTFLGGLIIFLFPVHHYIEMVEAISLTLTIGMLLFIFILELFPKMRKSKNKKLSMIGFFLGIGLILITLFF